jgi:hypothetical protein
MPTYPLYSTSTTSRSRNPRASLTQGVEKQRNLAKKRERPVGARPLGGMGFREGACVWQLLLSDPPVRAVQEIGR